jgi:hypothetical protein
MATSLGARAAGAFKPGKVDGLWLRIAPPLLLTAKHTRQRLIGEGIILVAVSTAANTTATATAIVGTTTVCITIASGDRAFAFAKLLQKFGIVGV